MKSGIKKKKDASNKKLRAEDIPHGVFYCPLPGKIMAYVPFRHTSAFFPRVCAFSVNALLNEAAAGIPAVRPIFNFLIIKIFSD
ncbi:MAG: hypothetical protein WBM07_00015 [Chitinivibrionales bacterium]